MRFRKETYVTMYAISTLKAPLAGSVQMLLGDKDRPTTSQKLNRLVEHGYLEKKPYGQQRVMYMLTLAGRAELQAFLSRNPAPTLHKRKNPTDNSARKEPKPKVEPKPYDPTVAQPRGVPYPTDPLS